MIAMVTGAGGQLARELVTTAPAGHRVVALGERDLDIRDRDAVRRAVRHHAPRTVINAAAYTAVDRAESERDLAYAVNRDGARHIAEASAQVGATLVHISTDFVFDGAASRPYAPEAATNPLSTYGASKLEGERAVRDECPEAVIVRTAWLYAPAGANFVATMLRLMAERGGVRVVSDQVGTPTNARGLAECCWGLAERRAAGMWHWTDAGVASWYDFAVAIAEFAVERGLLKTPPSVVPIKTEEYPTPARRPSFSVLDTSSTWSTLGVRAPHWRQPLKVAVEELAHGAARERAVAE